MIRGSSDSPEAHREAVGPEPGAGDRACRGDRAGGRVEDRRGAAARDAAHRDARVDLGAEPADLGGHRSCDRGEVDDAGLGGVERGDSGGVRLDLAQLRRAEAAQPRDAVRATSAGELVQGGQLGLVERDDELAAALVRRPRSRRSTSYSALRPAVQSWAFSDPGV